MIKQCSLQYYMTAATFAAILLFGIMLRVPNLHEPDFGVDEIIDVFLAKKLMEGNPPLLPSGQPYSRLAYTRTVAFAGKLLGLDEGTARLPSVVFGCLSIVMVFLIARQWYSNSAGLVAAFLTAVAPMEIAFSRQARMYAMFQFLYVSFILLFFQAFETSSRTNNKVWVPKRVKYWCGILEVRPICFVVAIAVFLLALNTHKLALVAISGPFMYLGCMMIVSTCSSKVSKIIKFKYTISVFFILLSVLGIYFLFNDYIDNKYLALISYAPGWAKNSVHDWRFYRSILETSYPVIFATFGLTSIFALVLNPKATLYLVICFTVPFLFHSFLLAWKIDRYIFHIVPLMFIVFSVGFCALVTCLCNSLTVWMGEAVRPFTSQITAGTLIVMATIFLLFSVPWFMQGLKTYHLNEGSFSGVQHNNWKIAMRFISKRASPSDIIVTSSTLLSKYYGPNLPLYFLNNSDLEPHQGLRDNKGRPIDYYTGAPMVMNLKALQEVVLSHPSGWFVTERFRFYKSLYAFPKDIILFIESNFHFEEVPYARDMVVCRWG